MACGRLGNFRVFFFVFSLQSGVILTIVIYATILITMFTIILYTLMVLNRWLLTDIIGLIIAVLHAILIIASLSLAYKGAYQENPKAVARGSHCILLALLLYISASIVSYIPSEIHEYACVARMCPDHVWMHNSFWRTHYYKYHTEENRIELMDFAAPHINKDYNLRHPILGLVLSAFYNAFYIIFLFYTYLTYLSFSKELREGIPAAFSRESWQAMNG